MPTATKNRPAGRHNDDERRARRDHSLRKTPFRVASRQMSRFSFTTGTVAAAASSVPINPIQLPATGFLSHIMLEVTIAAAGWTSAAQTADAPFSVLGSVELKTAAGSDIIAPMTGYQLYLINKYRCQGAQAPYSDARLGKQYSASTSTTAPSSHFFLRVPLEINPANALGSIPALASNRNYQLVLSLAPFAAFLGGTPGTANVTINGTAYYWSEPPAETQRGHEQHTHPEGVGTFHQYQLEQPAVTPGDKYITSHNVGNVIDVLVFTLRNSSGARIDTNGWPGVSEIYVDNEPMFYLTQNEWEQLMTEWYGFTATTKDVAQGLDTGVYVLPFFALASTMAGSGAKMSQALATNDATLLQLRGTSFGSASSTLEIITGSVVPASQATLFGFRHDGQQQ